MTWKVLIKCTLVSVLLLSGCAGVTSKEFYGKRESVSDANICKVYIDQFCSNNPKDTSYLGRSERILYYFHQDVKKEVERRYLGCGTCRKALNIRNLKVAAGLTAAAAVSYGIYEATKDSSGGGGGKNDSCPVTLGDYSWDAFYDQYNNLVWRCRDGSNGEFAKNGCCLYEVKTDKRWPSK